MAPSQGESELAGVDGMNAFAAFVMLYDRSLETILDLSPEVRLAAFGQLLGEERMVRQPLSLFPLDSSPFDVDDVECCHREQAAANCAQH